MGVKGIFGLLALLLVSCGSDEILTVRQFHLRKAKVPSGNEYVRSEMNYRLYGEVSAKEREAKKGQYYSVRWQDLSGTSSVRVVMEYRQAKSGSRIKKKALRFPPSKAGQAEFEVTGPSYLRQGRVISWRISLYEGGKRVAEKKSYLWD